MVFKSGVVMFMTQGNLAPRFQTRHLIILIIKRGEEEGTLTKRSRMEGVNTKRAGFYTQCAVHARVASANRVNTLQHLRQMTSTRPPSTRPPTRPSTAASNPKGSGVVAIYESRGRSVLLRACVANAHSRV